MKHEPVIIALDLGTTGNRAVAFSRSGGIVAQAYRRLTQHYPQPGRVEHDPIELYRTSLSALREVVGKAGAEQVHAMGITNQRETTIIWDRATGRPVHRAIVWQDRRTSAHCEALRSSRTAVKEKTGLIIDPYFSATKIAWILDAIDPDRRRSSRGELLFGTPDTWVLWQLTGGAVHATEPSNASRTMLFNIKKLEWDDELLGLFNIPAALLPHVYDSDTLFDVVDASLFNRSIPIAGIAGDQQASLFGQLGWDNRTIKATYGTGIFMLVNTGDTPRFTDNLITTVAWKRASQVNYALEGSLFMGGASIQWLQENLGIIDNPQATGSETIASARNEGVYFVPAFQGLGAPYWAPDARALIIGLSRKTDRTTIIRAAVEAMAYQVRDVVEAFLPAVGTLPRRIRADGGATRNEVLMQFQADLLGIPVVRSAVMETTALGVAGIAGIASGFWDEKSFAAIVNDERVFDPAPDRDREAYDRCYAGWKRAVQRSLGWAECICPQASELVNPNT
ncbi:MAG: glycerol kinase GlpK [Chitinispirillaceae bacterium]|nr:glycerol kinase GlpK [Chitinispirillaceae bacterium]